LSLKKARIPKTKDKRDILLENGRENEPVPELKSFKHDRWVLLARKSRESSVHDDRRLRQLNKFLFKSDCDLSPTAKGSSRNMEREVPGFRKTAPLLRGCAPPTGLNLTTGGELANPTTSCATQSSLG